MLPAAELLAQGWQHYQAGAVAKAEATYRRVIDSEPHNADAWFVLGFLQWNERRLDEAERSYLEALRLRPGFLEAQNNLGNVYVLRGKWAEAGQVYEEILRRWPDFAGTHNNLGCVRRSQGRLEEAVSSFQEALRLQPDFYEAHFNMGDVLSMLGRLEPAVASCERAVRLRPDSAEALMTLGTALAKLGRMGEAEAPLRRALKLRPDYGDAQVSLGNVLWSRRQYAGAEACFQEARRLMPERPEVHYNLGLVLAEQKRFEEAIACYREALRLNPRYFEAYGNLGNALGELGVMDQAMASYAEALRLNPGYTNARQNMANALRRQGKTAEALAVYEDLLRLQPDLPEAQMGFAFACLAQGDFQRGWPAYEWRWRCHDFGGTPFKHPLWDGSPLLGRTILLRAEQGLGDTLQFVRYAPLVKARGGRVILFCPESLARLFHGIAGVDACHVSGSGPLPPFDCQAPLMSLPGILGTTLDTIPAAVPYLRADPERVEAWQRELAAAGGFKVGICWQGSLLHRDDRLRSAPLACFAPLASVAGVKLYSLQIGQGTEQLASAPFPITPLGERFTNFADSAAAIEALDLVVTVDTAVAHLAGAIGAPVWLALAFASDWRWLLHREDSPWYPTARLFRQTAFGRLGRRF